MVHVWKMSQIEKVKPLSIYCFTSWNYHSKRKTNFFRKNYHNFITNKQYTFSILTFIPDNKVTSKRRVWLLWHEKFWEYIKRISPFNIILYNNFQCFKKVTFEELQCILCRVSRNSWQRRKFSFSGKKYFTFPWHFNVWNFYDYSINKIILYSPFLYLKIAWAAMGQQQGSILIGQLSQFFGNENYVQPTSIGYNINRYSAKTC